MLKNLGKELLEGVMTVVANWGAKGQEQIIDGVRRQGPASHGSRRIRSRPTATCWIFKEALEKAGAADRKKVAEAIRAMDTTEGPAKYFPGGRVKFDETRPARRCRSRHRAVAERRAGHRLSGLHRRWRSRSGRSQ